MLGFLRYNLHKSYITQQQAMPKIPWYDQILSTVVRYVPIRLDSSETEMVKCWEAGFVTHINIELQAA